jgi:ligand-binding sensor protein
MYGKCRFYIKGGVKMNGVMQLQEMERGFSIIELFGRETLVDIMHKIAATTGLAFATIDYRGDPVAGMESYSSFCNNIQADPCRKRICEASSALGAGQAAALQKPYIYFCPCGLLEGVIPIIVGGQFLGGLIGGQVRCHDAPPETMQMKTVFSHDQDYAEGVFRKEHAQLIRLPYEEFVHYIELIYLIVNQLGEKAMSDILRKRYHDEQTELQNQYHCEQTELQKEREKRIELENSLHAAQLSALRPQVNAYFLMSTLTTISNLAAIEDARQTNEVIAVLARFLSNSLGTCGDAEFIFSEMESVECYLYIQKVRMEEKLEYSVRVPEEMRMQRIPGMILFPFVEQAFNSGIMHKRGKAEIAVRAEYDSDDVVISISYDGPGRDAQAAGCVPARNTDEHPYTSLDRGTITARQRLINLFGKQYDAKIVSDRERGTTCTVRYPRSFGEESI